MRVRAKWDIHTITITILVRMKPHEVNKLGTNTQKLCLWLKEVRYLFLNRFSPFLSLNSFRIGDITCQWLMLKSKLVTVSPVCQGN